MAFNGSGTFTRAMNWVSDAAAGIKIRADRHDTEDNGFAAGLSNTICRDGQSVISADIPWNAKRITNLADPVNDQDAMTKKWGQSNLISGAYVADTQPAAAQAGNLWWDSDQGGLYLKYADGTSTQWVQVNVSSPAVSDRIFSAAADMWAGFNTGADRFVVNNKVDGTGGEALSVTDTGTVTSAAAFLSGVGTFGSVTATAILGTNSAGNVYLRPNGWSVTTGQATVTASGALTAATTINTDNGAGLFIGKVAADFYLQFLSGYNFNVNAGTGRLSLMLNGGLRAYWELAGNFYNSGAVAYKPGGGTWTDSSDARIKNVLGDYQPGLDEICALRPVTYTFKGNDTSEAPSSVPAPPPLPPDQLTDAPAPEVEEGEPTAPYSNSMHYQPAVDGNEFVGLIAQEVETVFPGMVTQRAGWIDGQQVEDLRDLNTSNLIFALVNAVKQLLTKNDALEARIEALEGGAR